jgi:peroxiredoxin
VKKIIGIATACLLSTQLNTNAQQNVTVQPSDVQPASSLPLKTDEQSQILSIGGIAPSLKVVAHNPMSAISGSTSDYLGQRAVQLLIITPDYSVPSSTTNFISGSSELEALWKSAEMPFVFVAGVSAKDAKLIPLLLHRAGYYEVTYTDNGNLAQRYGQSRPGATVVAIDRAGFIRHIDKVTDAKQARDLMLRISDPTPKLELGKPAPDFSMVDMNGTVRRLSDLRGKKNLLLTFFPKCFTGGCTNHLTSIQKEHLSYLASETETWAVSVDPAEGEKGQLAFAARWGFQFPLIPDEGRNLSILYGAAENPQQLASRMSVLIDKDGIVRLIDKSVDIHTHGSDMILQMRRLGMIPTAAAPNSDTEKM